MAGTPLPARASLTTRSLYPFVLAALARTPPAQRPSIRILDLPAGRGNRRFGGRQLFPKPRPNLFTAFDLAQQRCRPGGGHRALLGNLLEALLHVRQPTRCVARPLLPSGHVGALVRDPLARDR